MSNYTLSPNMSLPVPVVGVDPGPDWATNLNTALGLLDSHNHSSGQGVQITPSGLNMNSDLTFLANNATNLRSVRFTQNNAVLSGGSDLGCVYRVSADLYYNDGNGNQIRITQSGGIAGTPGSISGLVAPASATYVPGTSTFVWQSNVLTPANLDAGSVIIRQVLASANGITLSSPNSLAANYTITLPAGLPSAQAVLTTDTSGNTSFKSPYLTEFNAVVGTSGQVTGGIATHSTLTAAIAAIATNGMIKVLQGAWTENITVNKTCVIVGSGYNSIFTGTWTFSAVTYASVSNLQFTGNLTLDSSSNGNQMTGCYVGGSSTISDSGAGNYLELIQG